MGAAPDPDLGAVLDAEIGEQLATWRRRYRGRPRAERRALLLFALEREQIVTVAYREEVLAARVDALDVPEEVRAHLRRALAWVWRDEALHVEWVRGQLRHERRPVAAFVLLGHQAFGILGGWISTTRMHPAAGRWVADRLAQALVLGARLTGRLSPTLAKELRARTFGEYAALNVALEATAERSWRRLLELSTDDAEAAEVARIAEDERRHREAFDAIAELLGPDDRLRPGADVDAFAARLAEISPWFVHGDHPQAAALGPPSHDRVAVRGGAGTDHRRAIADAIRATGVLDDVPTGARVAVRTSFMLGYHRRDRSNVISADALDVLTTLFREAGAADVAVLDVPNVYDRYVANRTVGDVARYFGLTGGRWRIVDAERDQEPCAYPRGLGRTTISRTWIAADVRVVLAPACTDPVEHGHLSLCTLEGTGGRVEQTLYFGRYTDFRSATMMVLDVAPPHLAVVDAWGPVADGPVGVMGSHRPCDPRRVYAGRDPVAVDVAVLRDMGATDLRLVPIVATAAQWLGVELPDPVVDGPRAPGAALTAAPAPTPWDRLVCRLAFPMYTYGGAQGAGSSRPSTRRRSRRSAPPGGTSPPAGSWRSGCSACTRRPERQLAESRGQGQPPQGGAAMLRARPAIAALAMVVMAAGTTTAAQVATVAPAAATAPVVSPTIDPFDRASVLDAYQSTLVAARDVPTGWTGSTATCTKGTESAASIDATRAAVNFYRGLVGLPGVTEDPDKDSKALAAALMMQANGTIDHEPPTSWACYTADGADGANNSNLAKNAVGARAVDLAMVDPGASNVVAGHRRWILYPPTTSIGTGSTASYNALYVIPDPPYTRPVGAQWIAWPNAGYVPKSLVPTLFSLSSNVYPLADYSKATVTVKVGGTALPVTVHAPEGGYGDDALTWDVTLPADYYLNDADVRFDITVSGIVAVGIGTVPTVSYSSTAIVNDQPPTVPGAPTNVTATAGNAKATVSWSAPADNGGTPITGYKVTPYVGNVAQTTRTFASTATSQAITGLTNGTTYTFKVAATNGVGTGATSSASAAVTPTKPPYAPFASWGALVDRIFLDLTAKAPTSSERSTWVTALSNSSKTSGDLVEALRRGTDNTTNVDPTTRLYSAFLGRTPDAGGLKFWVGRRRSGAWTLNRMADSFASSSEFTRKYGSLTNRAFVTLIYTDVLGRTADPAGVDYWTRQLDLGRRTRGAVMVGFSESNEYKTKQANKVDAAVAYIFLLGRAPTATEVTDWATARTGGTSAAALAKQLLDSAAYATHIGG
ncbi:MAG: DUF4214 domain-containing protein [Acidimicrobiales bacterium]